MSETPLPPALEGDRVTKSTSAGAVNLYVAGDGAPMLLIHSVNAAASAAEVRPLQEYYRGHRRVFCIDLPGYGLSSRADLPYDPRIMTDAILAAVDHIRSVAGATPIDALALSLSCEYLARAASEKPDVFRTVAFVSPTGFRGGGERRGPPGSNRGIGWVYALLRGPGATRAGGWGRSLFRQLTRPGVIRYFLRRTWGSKEIDEALWHYDVLTAQPPGAEYAPLRFLSGYLFSGDVNTLYDHLTLPVWMSHGVRGDFTDYRNQTLVANRANWRITTFQTGALPHFEVPELFRSEYDRFLGST